MNDKNELPMVYQAALNEKTLWSIPSGKNAFESYEDCCIREIHEETGFKVSIINEVYRKQSYDFKDIYC